MSMILRIQPILGLSIFAAVLTTGPYEVAQANGFRFPDVESLDDWMKTAHPETDNRRVAAFIYAVADKLKDMVPVDGIDSAVANGSATRPDQRIKRERDLFGQLVGMKPDRLALYAGPIATSSRIGLIRIDRPYSRKTSKSLFGIGDGTDAFELIPAVRTEDGNVGAQVIYRSKGGGNEFRTLISLRPKKSTLDFRLYEVFTDNSQPSQAISGKVKPAGQSEGGAHGPLVSLTATYRLPGAFAHSPDESSTSAALLAFETTAETRMLDEAHLRADMPRKDAEAELAKAVKTITGKEPRERGQSTPIIANLQKLFGGHPIILYREVLKHAVPPTFGAEMGPRTPGQWPTRCQVGIAKQSWRIPVTNHTWERWRTHYVKPAQP